MQQRTRPLLCHSCAETDTEQIYKHVWLIICSEVLRRNVVGRETACMGVGGRGEWES